MEKLPSSWFCYSCIKDKPISDFNPRFRPDRKTWEIGKFCSGCNSIIKQFKKDINITYYNSAFLCILPGYNQCLDCAKILPIKEFYITKETGNFKNQCKQCHKRTHTDWRCFSGRYKEPFCILPQFKLCAKCKEIKPKLDFNISLKTDDGCNHRCLKCENSAAFLAKNSEKLKICNFCNISKPLKDFSLDKRNDSGVSNEYKRCHVIRGDKYRKILRKTSENFNLYSRIRSRIAYLLKFEGKVKDKSTLEFLGCDINKSKDYLLSKFKERYGYEIGWDVFLKGNFDLDHIVPANAFDFSSSEAIKLCFHYSNLQIIPSLENGIKNDKLPNRSCARFLVNKIKNSFDLNRVKDGRYPIADLTHYNCEI